MIKTHLNYEVFYFKRILLTDCINSIDKEKKGYHYE